MSRFAPTHHFDRFEAPTSAKSSWSSFSPVSDRKVADDKLSNHDLLMVAALRLIPIVQDGCRLGIRLVAKLNFRRSESEGDRHDRGGTGTFKYEAPMISHVPAGAGTRPTPCYGYR